MENEISSSKQANETTPIHPYSFSSSSEKYISSPLISTPNESVFLDFPKNHQIGQGSFGKVYKSFYIKSTYQPFPVAIKKIPMSSITESFPINALREISILKKCNHHPNVVDLYDIIIIPPTPPKREGSVSLIFEYMEHDIDTLIARGHKFTIGEIKNIMHQVLEGISYLHSNKICHRDIKGANILLNNKGTVKLCDFSLSRAIYPYNLLGKRSKIYTTNVVTLWYRAPELLLGLRNYNLLIDIWSAGCFFCELLLGYPIFKGTNEAEQMEEIIKICGAEVFFNWTWAKNLPGFELYVNNIIEGMPFECKLREKLNESEYKIDDVLYDLISRMLSMDPLNRISAKEALEHKFFSKDYFVDFEEIRPILDKDYHNYKLITHSNNANDEIRIKNDIINEINNIKIKQGDNCKIAYQEYADEYFLKGNYYKDCFKGKVIDVKDEVEAGKSKTDMLNKMIKMDIEKGNKVKKGNNCLCELDILNDFKVFDNK